MYQSKTTRDKSRIKDRGEVFTPSALVEEMLDELNFDWTDPSKKILEPSAGHGNFLVALLDRLMIGLESWEADPVLRHKHIIEHMLYGVELMQDNVDEAIERLNCRHLKHHIICADALTYSYKFDEYEPKADPLFMWPS